MTINVREPWAVYELEDLTDATGNQGNLDLRENAGAGRLGQGAAATNKVFGAGDLAFLFTGSSSFGIWYNVTANDLLFGDGLGLAESMLQSTATPSFIFGVGCDGTNIQIYLTGATTVTATTPVTTAGWHHFGFTRTGNSTQFFSDGVAVQAASDIAPAAEGGSDFYAFGLGEGQGRHDQITLAQVAYTAEEWAYIYNSGAGRLYEDWNPPAAGGNGHINLLTMGCG